MSQETLFEQLKHPNPHLRERAMWEIVETRDEATIPFLISVLDETDTTYRRAAVKVLGAIGLDTIPPLISSLLEDDNVTVRGSAAKALAQVALNYPEETFPNEGISALKQALYDENPVVHIASSMALGVIGVPGLDSLLEVLEETDNLGLAVAIVNAVSSINSERSKQVLQKLANDDATDTYVKDMATSALSRLEMLQTQLSKK